VKRLLPLLAVLAACASAPERYDFDGPTPRPPATTYTPAGAGAPTRGQPGSIDPERATLPRGQDKRVLPPEARPGVWASDGDARRALILRVKRPMPSPAEGISREAWRKCWSDVVEMLLNSEAALSLTETELECLRNTLLGECGQWYTGRADEYRKEGTRPDFLRRYFPDGEWDSRAFQEALVGNRNAKRCEGRGAWTRRVADLSVSLGEQGRESMGWRE